MPHEKLRTAADIGALVCLKRKEQKLSQEDLAGLANTGTRFISDLENGKSTIQTGKLLRVLTALGLGMYVFSRWEQDK